MKSLRQKIKTGSEKETFNLAKDLAVKLSGGEVLCLIGDLGAGKTAFTKGIAAGLKIKNIITSPTFVLMKVYEDKSGKLKTLCHIDAYRLTNGQALEEIGAQDYFNDSNCVTIIEWADRVKDIWPDRAILVEFKILEGDGREIFVH